jgi:hypothetical protein
MVNFLKVGITNQRGGLLFIFFASYGNSYVNLETVVAWDKNTGEPLYNAIVWLVRDISIICLSPYYTIKILKDDRTSSLAEDFIKKTPNQFIYPLIHI